MIALVGKGDGQPLPEVPVIAVMLFTNPIFPEPAAILVGEAGAASGLKAAPAAPPEPSCTNR